MYRWRHFKVLLFEIHEKFCQQSYLSFHMATQLYTYTCIKHLKYCYASILIQLVFDHLSYTVWNLLLLYCIAIVRLKYCYASNTNTTGNLNLSIHCSNLLYNFKL